VKEPKGGGSRGWTWGDGGEVRAKVKDVMGVERGEGRRERKRRERAKRGGGEGGKRGGGRGRRKGWDPGRVRE